MRSSFWATMGLVLLSTSSALQAQAPGGPPQQPGQPPAVSPEQQKALDGVLASWEADAKTLQSLFVQFTIEETDPTFKTKNKFFGEAKVLKMPTGQYGLRLETFNLDRNGQPDRNSIKDKIVCSGLWFYQFDIGARAINYRKLENQNTKPDDGPFAFLFGMKALDARKRFSMSIVQQDQHYTWIKINPLTDQDKRDFVVAQLGVIQYANAISPKDFPLQIMWREPGGKDLSWNFKSVVRNDLSRVSMADFTVENEKKQGWQLREAPALGAAGAPRTTPGIPTSGNGVPRK